MNWGNPLLFERIIVNLSQEFTKEVPDHMKIVIIYPYFIDQRIHEDDIQPVPMGVYQIGAVLKENGYDAGIWNWHDMGGQEDYGMSLVPHRLFEIEKIVLGDDFMKANTITT